ncbi:MAG: tetratricopeptide repeat protein [Planctomycetota bacterium]|nr:tetratricopeptide repeat protein [Planctomycetota bacterium]
MPKVAIICRAIPGLMLLVSLAQSGEEPLLKTIATGTYSLVLPQGHRPDSKYPIHIALHGAGDSCSNFARWWAEANRSRGIILAAPEGGDRRFWSDRDIDHIKAVLKDIVENCGGDPNRTMLSGFSAGCAMVFIYMDRFPTEFQVYAGTAHVVGTSLKSLKEAASKGVQVYYSVGKQDPNYRGYPESVRKLQESGIIFKAEDPDIGHTMIPEQQKNIVELFIAAADAKTLERVEAARKAVEAGRKAEAMRILRGVVPADGKALSAGQAKAKEFLDELAGKAGGTISDARKAEAEGKFDEALKLYDRAKREFEGTEFAAEADEAIKKIGADPKAKAFFEDMRRQAREKEAEDALRAAEEMEKKGEYGGALDRYKAAGERYADTAAGGRAKAALERLAKDPKAIAAEGEREARKMLSKADSYLANGMTAEAREIYEEIIRKYPDSSSAKQARRKLAGM